MIMITLLIPHFTKQCLGDTLCLALPAKPFFHMLDYGVLVKDSACKGESFVYTFCLINLPVCLKFEPNTPNGFGETLF